MTFARLQQMKDHCERKFVTQFVLKYGDNISLGCRETGVSRAHFYRLYHRHLLSVPNAVRRSPLGVLR